MANAFGISGRHLFLNGFRCTFNHLCTALVITALAIPTTGFTRNRKPDQNPGYSFKILRDAEIEYYLHRLAAPIFQAAGISPDSVHMALIQDDSLNAFVANGRNMFFHTGLILAMEDPLELTGVIAHETGHIADGHLIRGRAAMQDASTAAILATVLGVATVASTGRADAGFAVIAGGQQIASRSLFAFSRTQEASADQAGLRFLDDAHLSARGFQKFMEKLADQDLLPQGRQSAYVRTHPLTRERVDTITEHSNSSPWRDHTVSADMVADFRRIRAKIEGYLFPKNVLQRYDSADRKPEARYARAIALWRSSNYDEALKMMTDLVTSAPDDPFFAEQKGQIEVETGHLAAGVKSLATAWRLAPDQPLIGLEYAQAVLQSGTSSPGKIVIPVLHDVIRQDHTLSLAHQLLAQAYAHDGREAEARLSSAEAAFLERDLPAARQHITVAMKGFPKSSPEMIRAQDLDAQITRAEEESEE